MGPDSRFRFEFYLRWAFRAWRGSLIFAHGSLKTIKRLTKPFSQLWKFSGPVDNQNDGENEEEFDPTKGSKHASLAFRMLSVPRSTTPWIGDTFLYV